MKLKSPTPPRHTRKAAPVGMFDELVVDLFARPDRCGPAFSLLFGLNMALVSRTSHVHSFSDVERYFSLAGLTDVRAREIPDSLYGLVRGTRR